MSSRQGWSADLLTNSGAATGSWFQFPGGICGVTFEGTVTDVDVEIASNATGSDVACAVADWTTIAAVSYVAVALPPCKIRAVVNTGSAVYVRASKVI
jgi:hypothetical protein